LIVGLSVDVAVERVEEYRRGTGRRRIEKSLQLKLILRMILVL